MRAVELVEHPVRRRRRATGGCAPWRSGRRNRARRRAASRRGRPAGWRRRRRAAPRSPRRRGRRQNRSASARSRLRLRLETVHRGPAVLLRKAAPKRCDALRHFQPPASSSFRKKARRAVGLGERVVAPTIAASAACAPRSVRLSRARQAPRQARRNPRGSSPPPRRSRRQSASSRLAVGKRQAGGGGRRARRPRPPCSPSDARSIDPAADRVALCDRRASSACADLLVGGVLRQVAHGAPEPRVAARAAAWSMTSARAVAISAAAAVSSRTANWPGTFASNGNWCSSRSQKAWIVWIFSPPGVSSALREEPARAGASRRAGGAGPAASRSRLASSASPASSIRRASRRRGAPSRPRRPW